MKIIINFIVAQTSNSIFASRAFYYFKGTVEVGCCDIAQQKKKDDEARVKNIFSQIVSFKQKEKDTTKYSECYKGIEVIKKGEIFSHKLYFFFLKKYK